MSHTALEKKPRPDCERHLTHDIECKGFVAPDGTIFCRHSRGCPVATRSGRADRIASERTDDPDGGTPLPAGGSADAGALTDARALTDAGASTDAEASPRAGEAAEAPGDTAKATPRRTPLASLIALGWEPLFVALTFVTMIGGLVASGAGAAELATVLYAAAYLFGGYFGVRASIESLRAGKIDIDLLMVLAAAGAWAVGAPFEGALLLFLFSLSNVLQDFALDRTRNAIRALSKLRPDTAIVLESADSERGEVVKIDGVPLGALLQVRPGDRIPLDGVVERGASSVDQSSITGESMPVDKERGSDVLAGTINQNGELVVRVTRTSSESTIAKVIQLVEHAQENKAETERFLNRFEQHYAMFVILATIVAAIAPPYLFGWSWSISIYRAITLMVAASPCALIISTPASILSSIGNGARRGILFKGGVHVEQAAGIRAVAFDKTGTLTEGKPVLTGVYPTAEITEDELLAACASLESKSAHVLAEAIVAAAAERGLTYRSPQHFENTSGVGILGIVDGRRLSLGSPAILEQMDGGVDGVAEQIDELQSEANTVIVLTETNGTGGRVLGLLALRDRIRPEARRVIAELKEAGIEHVVMLTGDNRRTAEAIAREAGVDEVISELLPDEKLSAVERIERRYGPTAMVGDGVNDAPALAGARLGIAMGAAGTDVALETADVVLLSDDLSKLPHLVALSRRTKRTLVTNLAVAMGLIALMVVGIYTIDLPLPLAVVGHEGGTVLVSLNGLRLLMFRKGRLKAKRGADNTPAM